LDVGRLCPALDGRCCDFPAVPEAPPPDDDPPPPPYPYKFDATLMAGATLVLTPPDDEPPLPLGRRVAPADDGRCWLLIQLKMHRTPSRFLIPLDGELHKRTRWRWLCSSSSLFLDRKENATNTREG
jgi:hypothetical protein